MFRVRECVESVTEAGEMVTEAVEGSGRVLREPGMTNLGSDRVFSGSARVFMESRESVKRACPVPKQGVEGLLTWQGKLFRVPDVVWRW